MQWFLDSLDALKKHREDGKGCKRVDGCGFGEDAGENAEIPRVSMFSIFISRKFLFGILHSKNASKIVQNVSKWPKKNASENVIKKVQRRTKKWLKKRGGLARNGFWAFFQKIRLIEDRLGLFWEEKYVKKLYSF